MFENVIGHDHVTARLRKEVEGESLPASMLFFGPPYAGKLTTALELARGLTCLTGGARWNCSCKSCEMQRLLIHPDTLLLGGRYFWHEITACADVLARIRKPPAQYLYARAVRKLTRRFDPLLWEGTEPKLKAVGSLVQEAEDLLAGLLPGEELPEEPKLAKTLARIGELARKIVPAASDTIPIGQIRRVTAWAYTTTAGPKKVIIIESADRMLESARNALLKVLEEPPRGIHFILTTTRRAALMPTILSRLRPYHFPERDETGSREVLAKIFREEVEASVAGGMGPAETAATVSAGSRSYRTLRDYFLAWDETDIDRLRGLAGRFLSLVVAGRAAPLEDELLAAVATDASFRPFLEELLGLLQASLKEARDGQIGVGISRIAVWNRLIREAAAQHEAYNQGPALLVESLYYRMKEGLV